MGATINSSEMMLYRKQGNLVVKFHYTWLSICTWQLASSISPPNVNRFDNHDEIKLVSNGRKERNLLI